MHFSFAFLFSSYREMSKEFDLIKTFVALQNEEAPIPKRLAQRGRGRGARQVGQTRPIPPQPQPKDSAETESLGRSVDQPGTSDLCETESRPVAGSSRLSAGKNSVRNKRQRMNLAAKCARAEARANALQEALKHCLEELEVLKTEKSQTQSCISQLKRDVSQLRAQLSEQGSDAQTAAADTAADEQSLMDLDQCIQSISN